MKIAWLELTSVGFNDVIDAGVLLTEGPELGFQNIVAAGMAVEYDMFDSIEHKYPELSRVNSVVSPLSVEKVDEEFFKTLVDYCGDNEQLVLRTHTDIDLLEDLLPETMSMMTHVQDLGVIEEALAVLGIPSEHHHDPTDALYPERAVNRCLYHVQEMAVYRSNLMAYGSGELADQIDDLQQEVEDYNHVVSYLVHGARYQPAEEGVVEMPIVEFPAGFVPATKKLREALELAGD